MRDHHTQQHGECATRKAEAWLLAEPRIGDRRRKNRDQICVKRRLRHGNSRKHIRPAEIGAWSVEPRDKGRIASLRGWRSVARRWRLAKREQARSCRSKRRS